MKERDPQAVLTALVKHHGSRRAVAEALDYNYVALCDVIRGNRPFSAVLLKKLGLRRAIVEDPPRR